MRIREITSLTNPCIKDIKALRLKKNRSQTGLFVVEGFSFVLEGLNKGWLIQTLIIEKSQSVSLFSQELMARVIKTKGQVFIVNENILKKITQRENTQMVVAVFFQRFALLETINLKPSDLWVVLDNIRDPGNLGTIVRTVDAAGGNGLILVGETTDPFSFDCIRATMGSIFSVPMIKCSTETLLLWKRKFSYLVTIGTLRDASLHYTACKNFVRKAILLLMGNEKNGLSYDLLNNCDEFVAIPQEKHVDSLNVAIATGVMLFEIRSHQLGLRS